NAAGARGGGPAAPGGEAAAPLPPALAKSSRPPGPPFGHLFSWRVRPFAAKMAPAGCPAGPKEDPRMSHRRHVPSFPITTPCLLGVLLAIGAGLLLLPESRADRPARAPEKLAGIEK